MNHGAARRVSSLKLKVQRSADWRGDAKSSVGQVKNVAGEGRFRPRNPINLVRKGRSRRRMPIGVRQRQHVDEVKGNG